MDIPTRIIMGYPIDCLGAYKVGMGNGHEASGGWWPGRLIVRSEEHMPKALD